MLKMTLDHAVDAAHLIAKNPASRTKFPPMRPTTHIYLTAAEVAALARARGDQGDVVFILAYTGLRFFELTGLTSRTWSWTLGAFGFAALSRKSGASWSRETRSRWLGAAQYRSRNDWCRC